MMARFISGLKYKIACSVELQRYDTLEDAMQLALKVGIQRQSNPYKAVNSRYDSSNKPYGFDSKAVEKKTVEIDVKTDRSVVDKGNEVYSSEDKKDTSGPFGGKSH